MRESRCTRKQTMLCDERLIVSQSDGFTFDQGEGVILTNEKGYVM